MTRRPPNPPRGPRQSLLPTGTRDPDFDSLVSASHRFSFKQEKCEEVRQRSDFSHTTF